MVEFSFMLQLLKFFCTLLLTVYSDTVQCYLHNVITLHLFHPWKSLSLYGILGPPRTLSGYAHRYLLQFDFYSICLRVCLFWTYLRNHTSKHTHTTILRLSWILSGTTRVSRHQKGKTNLDLLEQEIVSGIGIRWATWKSAAWPRHITTPASHHSFFYRLDALPAAQPTALKHWRQTTHPNFTKFSVLVALALAALHCYESFYRCIIP